MLQMSPRRYEAVSEDRRPLRTVPSSAEPSVEHVTDIDQEALAHVPSEAAPEKVQLSSHPLINRILCAACRVDVDRTTSIATGMMVLSAFFYSLQSLNVKELSGEFAFFTVSFCRGLSGTAASLAVLLLRNGRTTPIFGTPPMRRWLLLRGLLGGITIIAAFAAVSAMDLAVAAVIISTAPFWTAGLAVVFEKGSWTRFDTAAAILCTLGMILVVKPGFSHTQAASSGPAVTGRGVTYALISAVSMAGVNMTVRKVKKEETNVITLYAMLGSLVLAFPGMVYEQSRGVGERFQDDIVIDVIQLLVTGLLSWLAQVNKTYALQISKSVGVLVMRYLDIFFAFIWDGLFLRKKHDPLSIVGALLIMSACVGSVLAKGI